MSVVFQTVILQCKALSVTVVSWVLCKTAPLSVTCQSGGTEVGTKVQQYITEQSVQGSPKFCKSIQHCSALVCNFQELFECGNIQTTCSVLGCAKVWPDSWVRAKVRAWVVSRAALFSRADILSVTFSTPFKGFPYRHERIRNLRWWLHIQH